MRAFLLFLTIPFSLTLFSQKETAHWITTGGIHFDFNYDPVRISYDYPQMANSLSGTAISDSLGNLLFFTDGIKLYDRNGDLVLGGEDLGGIDGAVQNTQICPILCTGRYYIFGTDVLMTTTMDTTCCDTLWGPFDNYRLHYTLVEVDGDTNVSIIEKNVSLGQSVIGNFEVALHEDKEHLWLTTINLDTAYYFETWLFDTEQVLDQSKRYIERNGVLLALVEQQGYPFKIRFNPSATRIYTDNLPHYEFDVGSGRIDSAMLGAGNLNYPFVSNPYYDTLNFYKRDFFYWSADTSYYFTSKDYKGLSVNNSEFSTVYDWDGDDKDYSLFALRLLDNHGIEYGQFLPSYGNILSPYDDHEYVRSRENYQNLLKVSRYEEEPELYWWRTREIYYRFPTEVLARNFTQPRYPHYITYPNNKAPQRVYDYEVTSDKVCSGNEIQISANVPSNANINYFIIEGDTLFTDQNTLQKVVQGSGYSTGQISFSGSCYDQEGTFEYFVDSPIITELEEEYVVNLCDSNSLMISIPYENIGSVMWGDSDTSHVKELGLGSYELTLSNSCETIVERTEVVAKPEIEISNVITTNGDGKNDYFELDDLSPNHELTIRNRWGKVIYKTTNYQNEWSGYDQLSGTYFYELINNECYYTGWIQLLK